MAPGSDPSGQPQAAPPQCDAGEEALLESQTNDSIRTSAADAPFSGTRVSRVGKAMSALSLGALVNILSQLTIVPVALHTWGKFRYGEWILLTGLVQFLKLTDLGLQTYVDNRLCTAYARRDRDELHRVLHSALRLQLPLTAIVLVVVAAGFLFAPVANWLGLHTISGPSLLAVALLLSLDLLIGIPMGVLAGIYRASGNMARAGFVGAVQQFLTLMLTLAILIASRSFAVLASARLLVTLVLSLWIVHDIHRLHPWLRLFPRDGSWRAGLEMVVPGSFFLLVPLGDYLATQLSLTVTQRVLGGAEVTHFATHRTIANFGVLASSMLTLAIWPELTALDALDRKENLRSVHRRLTALNVWLVGAAVFGLLPFLPFIYPLWTARSLSLDFWTMAFLLGRVMLWAAWNPSAVVLMATNRHRPVALLLITEGLLTGAAALLLVPVMGIKGAALAALLADVCVCAWAVPRLAARANEDTFRGLLFSSMKRLLPHAVGVGLGLTAWQLTNSMLVRYLLALPITVVVVLSGIALQMDSGDKQVILRVYERLTGRAGQA